MAPSWW
jgi:hypothetical protein